MTLKFDRQECSRCFGLGRYGPASVYGGKCFKCAGKGKLLTAAASKLAQQLAAAKLVAYPDIQVGQRLVWDSPFGRTKVIVREVVIDGRNVRIKCSTDAKPDYFYSYQGDETSTLSTPWSDEQIQAFLGSIAYVGKRLRKGLVVVEEINTE